ncbi:uncharacterized protein LOC131640614 [Vicia villosa]|uniref:uncharacterized protein LOC131640614 n=1 Tax=Vicia villosa TaxID=3911 RepID=UPI00273BFEE2|nr:uncharacterized protein LOC131640614 [Vicia villosa]
MKLFIFFPKIYLSNVQRVFYRSFKALLIKSKPTKLGKELCLAAYGAYVRPMPYSNEIGLRMLIGGVVREAVVLGYHITLLFSYYAYHGPVFRVLLRLNRGKVHDSIRVLLCIATSVEIPMNFLGTNSVSSVASAVCQRFQTPLRYQDLFGQGLFMMQSILQTR